MPIDQGDFESQENQIFRDSAGQEVGTGLWVPAEKDKTYEDYLQAGPEPLDAKQIKEILDNSHRLPARTRFPRKHWIRSQGSRGSCNGYAGAWALARARVTAGLPFVPLSGEFVYSGINGGRDHGSGLAQGMKFLQETGVAREDLVEHLEYKWRRISQAAKADAANHKGFELYRADDEGSLAAGIASGGIAVVAVEFGRRMQQLDERGVAGGQRGRGNHSVGVDDLRINPRGQYEFDFFNSHGLRYGDKGKAWLTWDRHFAQTSRVHCFYIIRAVSGDLAGGGSLPEVIV